MAEDNNLWNGGQNTQPNEGQTTPANPDDQSAQTSPTEPVPQEGTAGQSASTTQEHAEGQTAPAAWPSEAPDYASAKGEQTVVSSEPQPNEQPTTPMPAYGQNSPYRPAPEFGAYGPTPTPTPQPGQQNTAIGGNAGNANNGAPYANGNPFAPQNQPTQQFPPQGQGAPNGRPANGNPFMQGAPTGPNGQMPPAGPGNFFPGRPGQPNQPGQPQRKPLSNAVVGVISAIVAAVVVAALCLGLGFAAITNGWITLPSSSNLSSVTSNKSGSGSATAKSGEAPDWQTVASDVSSSVVAIQTVLSNGSAKGSGAILDTEGHIVTNNHVISGAQKIQVTLSNGQIYAAKLVGTDVTTDLAVIKLDNPPSDLKPVTFADSSKLAVGENIMAVGNPLGYDDTATTGIVSALNRPVSVMDEESGSQIVTNAVQIDAAINPGNSGGPTFNAAGEVIGINSSIASTASSSESAGSIGIGFAIPSNLVKRVADEIIKDGKVQHVALGVTITTSAVEADGVTRSGARITTPSTGGSAVVEGGPADKAGLKAGDTIVAFDGNAVNNNESLLGFVRAAAMGDKVTLTIVRDGKTMDVNVTLDQAEQAVNGTNKSENSQNSQNGNNGTDGQQGQGDGGDGSDGNGFGFSDPFGFW